VAASVAPGPAAAASGTGASAADTAEPNLGPPAARLDWRRR
jgi:hypothetical protein